MINESIDRSADANGLAGEGILIFERNGPKSHGGIAASAVFGRAVHGVAENGEASVLEMEANLVSAASDRAGFDESEIVFLFQKLEVSFGVF